MIFTLSKTVNRAFFCYVFIYIHKNIHNDYNHCDNRVIGYQKKNPQKTPIVSENHHLCGYKHQKTVQAPKPECQIFAFALFKVKNCDKIIYNCGYCKNCAHQHTSGNIGDAAYFVHQCKLAVDEKYGVPCDNGA